MATRNRVRRLMGGMLTMVVVVLLTGAAAPTSPLAKYQAAEKLVARHIATFDTLDYTVFTYQQWTRDQVSSTLLFCVAYEATLISVGWAVTGSGLGNK